MAVPTLPGKNRDGAEVSDLRGVAERANDVKNVVAGLKAIQQGSGFANRLRARW